MVTLRDLFEWNLKEAMAKNKKLKKKKKNKVSIVYDEFKKGTLHTGSKQGPIVTNPKQAIAIGLSEQRKLNRKK